MSSRDLKPGLTQGQYPERSEDDTSLVEQKIQHYINRARNGLFTRASELDDFARKVLSWQQDFEILTKEDLNSHILDMRFLLARDGFTQAHCAKTFALIREVSYRTLGMRHFDSQIKGGWVILQGRLAEMQTGEGKTLTATLPAATAALAGVPTHVITVNEYLSQRDCEEMSPVYKALGLTVGFVDATMTPTEKKEIYAKDIAYCTNNQIAFDYLRDQITIGQKKGKFRRTFDKYNESTKRNPLMLRGLCYAIVDEADSVLIDEARTPLIIAKDHSNPTQISTYKEALQLARKLEIKIHFNLDKSDKAVYLTPKGKKHLVELTLDMPGVWQGDSRREYLVQQALSAIFHYRRDEQYLVKEDKIHIIDENTGRLQSDRSWERGLHQMIETKEKCPISGLKETLARLTYQRFFRRYLMLSGMSGTVQEVEDELQFVYDLNVVKIPTHKLCRRIGYPENVYKTKQAKWKAIMKQVKLIHDTGRPILIGTCSVKESELLGQMLTELALPHHVLNARQDNIEAEIISKAGHFGAITVATNMAGRGTDIKLSEEVSELGGLHVISTEKNESARVDRQLYGRSARQGDPGSYQCIASLEDTIFKGFYPKWLLMLLKIGFGNAPINRKLGQLLGYLPQRYAENYYKKMRLDLIKQDKELSRMLAFTGKLE